MNQKSTEKKNRVDQRNGMKEETGEIEVM